MNTKHFCTTTCATCFLHLLSAQPGTLDQTFGDGGKVIAAIGTENDLAHAAILQPDGKIVAAGWTKTGTKNDFSLARFNPNGTTDHHFGDGGTLITDFEGDDDQAIAVVLQPDCRIVAAGWSFNGADLDFALARYHPDGSLDETFGIGGKQTTDLGASDYISSVAIQPDGKIVVAGHTTALGTIDFALARYLPNGGLDTDFGAGGTVVTDFFQNSDFGASLALQSDGKIVVAGLAINGAGYDFALARYNTDGTLDPSFGTGGKITTAFGSSDDKGITVLVQPDGKILAGGFLFNGAHYDFALARYETDGTLDKGFGNAGKTVTDFVGKDDLIASLALQHDGSIVAAGRSSNGQHYNFALARYRPDGTPDDAFGTSGWVITPISAGRNAAFAALVQPDGNIVLAGYAQTGITEDFALARYISGPSVSVDDVLPTAIPAAVFPNPVQQKAILEYTLHAPTTVTIQLLDMQGRRLQTFTEHAHQPAGTHQSTISLPAHLPPGKYWVAITADEGHAMVGIVK